MTHDETRDELARMDGWNKPGTFRADTGNELLDAMNRTIARGNWWKSNSDGTLYTANGHPHPPTLDGANAAVPEGWKWHRGTLEWFATAPDGWVRASTVARDTGNPTDDLYALALACRRAMEEKR